MTIQQISAQQANELCSEGAVLIDIRDADAYARERIANARLVPLADLERAPLPDSGPNPVIFHCQLGGRTSSNAPRLLAAAGRDCYILDGGIEAWKRAGLPVIRDKKQPLELMRQVQIAAGVLVTGSVLLGSAVSGAFYAVAGFVGAGLVFAGVTGTCGMARLLKLMPWNQR
jgi:rhodanese-related sulfurtransferase